MPCLFPSLISELKFAFLIRMQKSSTPIEKDNNNSVFNSKSSMGSTRKRKRRSIAGLAKVISLVIYSIIIPVASTAGNF